MDIGDEEDLLFGLKVKRPASANLCVVGLPWDASSTFRRSSKEAPSAIRRITTAKFYDPFTEDGIDLTRVWRIYDHGDMNITMPTSRMRKEVFDVIGSLYDDGLKFLFLGGDHLVTYFCLHALTRLGKRTWALVYLDSHLDLQDEHEGDRYSHACVVRRIVEDTNLPPKNIVEVGARSYQPAERKFARDMGISTMSTVEFEKLGARGAAKRVSELLPEHAEKIYLSIDLDILDPAHAPGSCYPEPGGISTRSLLDFICGLRGLEISAFDVVELCPKHDSSSITTIAVGKIILETLGVLRGPRKPPH